MVALITLIGAPRPYMPLSHAADLKVCRAFAASLEEDARRASEVVATILVIAACAISAA